MSSVILRFKTEFQEVNNTSNRVFAKCKYGDVEMKDEYLVIPCNNRDSYLYCFKTKKWFKQIAQTAPIIVSEVPTLFLSVDSDELVVLDNEFFDLVYTEDTTIDEYYRFARSVVCFPIINRGPLWYEHLTMSQQTDLNTWYEYWLDAPETHIYPVTPYWVNEKLSKLKVEEIY